MWEPRHRGECLRAVEALSRRGRRSYSRGLQASALLSQSAKVEHSQRSMVPVRQHR
jgi:hypothetical protein